MEEMIWQGMTVRLVTAGALYMAALGCVAQVPQHPITTAPEGKQPECSYSVTGSDNGKVSGTNTCAPAPAADALSQTNDAICARESKAERELDLRCPSGDAATAPPAPKANAAEKFPFPGEQSTPAAAPAEDKPAPPQAPALQDAGSSGESSSMGGESSSSSAGPAPSADDVTSDTPVAPKRNTRKKPTPVQGEMTSDKRETEDLNVASFYQNDGNYQGAYMRAKDAVALAGEDPEAHLALGLAARKLGKLDEARENFERTLALDPVPKTKKEAQKALQEMTGG